ncbi:MAG: hypothetical protein KDH09_17595 [Chrysiogenetes bacterium]|nr:hypothetical protein [Chrysiogenetes bacterium]
MRDIRRVQKHLGKPAALFVALFVAIATFGLTTTAQAKEDFQAYWDNGIRLKSDNVSVKFGGRVMVDAMWGVGNRDFEVNLNGGPYLDGVEFRRLRFYNAGTINKKVGWKVQIDYANNALSLKDAYVTFKDVFAGFSVTVGNQKEPFSLEEQTSSKYITFMERSLANAFSPGRTVGLQVANHSLLDGKATVAASISRPTILGGSEDGEYAFGGRVTFAPILEDKGERVVHVGIAYRFHEDPYQSKVNEFRFRERPEIHISPRYVNTGNFDADTIQELGFELAAQFGMVNVQGEYILAIVSNDGVVGGTFGGTNATGEPKFHAWYVQASVFATGEFRPYKGGAFSRVKPNNELGKDGIGAIEIAARLSSINLTDRAEAVAGGNELNFNLGVNWYMTPNARVMFNYVYASFDELAAPPLKEGHLQAVQTRFQVDF